MITAIVDPNNIRTEIEERDNFLSTKDKEEIKANIRSGYTCIVYKRGLFKFSTNKDTSSSAAEYQVTTTSKKTITDILKIQGYVISSVYLSVLVEGVDIKEREDLHIGNIVLAKSANLKRLILQKNFMMMGSTNWGWRKRPKDSILDLSHATNLTELYIAFSYIKKVVLPKEGRLKKLTLINNGIEEMSLPEGLEEINIRNNNIKEISVPSDARLLTCDNIKFANDVPEDCEVIFFSEPDPPS